MKKRRFTEVPKSVRELPHTSQEAGMAKNSTVTRPKTRVPVHKT